MEYTTCLRSFCCLSDASSSTEPGMLCGVLALAVHPPPDDMLLLQQVKQHSNYTLHYKEHAQCLSSYTFFLFFFTHIVFRHSTHIRLSKPTCFCCCMTKARPFRSSRLVRGRHKPTAESPIQRAKSEGDFVLKQRDRGMDPCLG